MTNENFEGQAKEEALFVPVEVSCLRLTKNQLHC